MRATSGQQRPPIASAGERAWNPTTRRRDFAVSKTRSNACAVCKRTQVTNTSGGPSAAAHYLEATMNNIKSRKDFVTTLKLFSSAFLLCGTQILVSGQPGRRPTSTATPSTVDEERPTQQRNVQAEQAR